MRKISDKEINDDINLGNKPTLYTNLPVPLNELGDRCFEILLYLIFKERLKIKDAEVINIADNISLMQGINERGRDVILSNKGKNTAVIQCKKYKNNLPRPEAAQEILKFLLHYLKDKTLIGDPDDFTYYMAVSTGFSGNTIGSFNDFSHYLINEPKLKEWVENIFRDYPRSFKGITFSKIETELLELIRRIKIKKIIPQDIEFWISEFENLNKIFFRVLAVTDNTLLEQIISTYLKPILHKLNIINLDTPDYTFRFKEYLKNSYEIFSSAKTLVFGNQQKKLEDIYFPLSAGKKSNSWSDENKEVYKIDKFSDEFIPRYKKVLIIDDGGMGKSTLLKWLFLSCIKLNKGIPIFIELRNISKENDIIEEITNKLNPLNKTLERKATASILSDKGFVFLFDGYDEIKNSNREFVTLNLEDFISKCSNSYFVLTSRPEKSLLTFSDFQEFSIRKLNKTEAFELIKKIDNYQDRSQRLIDQIENNHLTGIDDFLGNPLLVSLLYKKFEYRESIPFKKQEFFYEVFEALFQAHDLSKGGSYLREKESNLSSSQFFQLLRGIGYECIKEGIQFNESQLHTLVERVSNDYLINVDTSLFINDLTKAVPLFQKDGLTIKWAHKSIQQYFAAEYICRDGKGNQKKILEALYKSEDVSKYSQILELCYEIDYKSFKHSILKKFCNEYMDYSKKMFPNLRQIINERLIEERCSVLFFYNFFLIKSKKNTSNRTNITVKQRKSIKSRWKLETETVIFFGETTKDEIGIGTSDYYIFSFSFSEFLRVVKSNLVVMKTLDKGWTEMNSQLPISEKQLFFCDDDDVQNPCNLEKNFETVTKLISLIVPSIETNYVKSMLQEIEEETLSIKKIPKF